MAENQEAREWLRANGYEDVADLIDEVMEEWREAGNHTRRNWWDILAGGKHGTPRTVAGREFPVLKSAQRRQKVPLTDNALCRKKRETRQAIWTPNRWEGHVSTKEKESDNASK